MLVIIAGAGRTGAQLARLLLSQEHEVHIIEHRREVLARIHRELPSEIVYEGNPIDPTVLERAGISSAEVIAACTTSDADNLVICYVARCCYGVGRTIARINNPRDAWLFNDIFHVDVALNQAEIFAHMIEEEMSMGDMMTLLKLRRGKYSLVEEKIPAGAPVIGKQIRELGLIDQCVIAAIVRKGEVIVPRGVTVFETDDEVLAVTNRDGAQQLLQLFTPPDRETNNKSLNGSSKS